MLEKLPQKTEGTKQDPSEGNYWRKRTPHDTVLDPRMPTDVIVRLVNSYTNPYPCAKLVIKDQVIPIVRAVIAKNDLTDEEVRRMEPGKIVKVDGNKFTMKVGDGLVELDAKEIPIGLEKVNYVHPPTLYIESNPEIMKLLS